MCVSKSNGIPKSSILIGFSIINHPFCGTPIFGNTHMTMEEFKHFSEMMIPAVETTCEKNTVVLQLSAATNFLPPSQGLPPQKKKHTHKAGDPNKTSALPKRRKKNIWMFPKIVGFPPKSSILIGFSMIFTIHFGGFPQHF